MTKKDNRLRVPQDLWESFKYYSEDERKRVESPEVRRLITPESLMVESLRNQVERVGHWPVKVGKESDPHA